jgi:hypothetical protein
LRLSGGRRYRHPGRDYPAQALHPFPLPES